MTYKIVLVHKSHFKIINIERFNHVLDWTPGLWSFFFQIFKIAIVIRPGLCPKFKFYVFKVFL